MTNMKKDVIWTIRDARGLTTYEKAFLFVVASRGTAKTYRTTLMNDLACSTGQITKIVRSLSGQGLIKVYPGRWVEGKKTQTVYTVNESALKALVPERGSSPDELHDSPHERGSSLHERGSSLHERGSSRGGGYKETGKETRKVTMKETKKETRKSEGDFISDLDEREPYVSEGDLIILNRMERERAVDEILKTMNEETT